MARTRAGGKAAAKGKVHGGPPTKLTPELIKEVETMVRLGVSPERALLARGVAQRTIQAWKSGARTGNGEAAAAFERFAQAEAECEVRDVATTAKAAYPERRGVIACAGCGRVHDMTCTGCGNEVKPDLGELEGTHRLLSMAAGHAMDRLARRFPDRWSSQVRVTVDRELEQFLDIAADVLERDQFDRLLDAYAQRMKDAVG